MRSRQEHMTQCIFSDDPQRLAGWAARGIMWKYSHKIRVDVYRFMTSPVTGSWKSRLLWFVFRMLLGRDRGDV